MKWTARLLAVCAGSILLIAQANAEPICKEHAIKMVLPYSAGTSVDTATRVLAKAMEEVLSQPIGVVNMPGAAGQIGAQYLAAATPDGCTLGSFNNSPITMRGIKQLHGGNPSYDPAQEFSVIGRTYEISFVLAVNSQSSIRTLDELIARARKEPGQVKLGVSWMLGDSTLFLLHSHFNVDLAPIPYRKGDINALPDIVSDRIQGAVMTIGVALPRIQSGELYPLFVFAKSRLPELPSTPTVHELGFKELASVSSWQGLLAPAGLPQDKIQRLNAALRAALAEQKTVEALAVLAMRPDPSTQEELQTLIREQLLVWDGLYQSGAFTIE